MSRDNLSCLLFALVTYRHVKNWFTHLFDRNQRTLCLNPSHTRPSFRYVNVKPVWRSTNLYDVEGLQQKPIRIWCDLYGVLADVGEFFTCSKNCSEDVSEQGRSKDSVKMWKQRHGRSTNGERSKDSVKTNGKVYTTFLLRSYCILTASILPQLRTHHVHFRFLQRQRYIQPRCIRQH